MGKRHSRSGHQPSQPPLLDAPTALEELLEALEQGTAIAGIDEAGRGPWAGPVVAAAVILNPNCVPEGLTDSKKLSPLARDRLYDEIVANHVVGVGLKSAAEIDAMNIRAATLAAMREALVAMPATALGALIDGRDVPPGLQCRGAAIVQGDLLVPCISAASVIAKVTRDRLMMNVAKAFPHYGFDAHVGYGTRAHAEALNRYGPCPEHRISFKPVALVAAGGRLEWGQKETRL